MPARTLPDPVAANHAVMTGRRTAATTGRPDRRDSPIAAAGNLRPANLVDTGEDRARADLPTAAHEMATIRRATAPTGVIGPAVMPTARRVPGRRATANDRTPAAGTAVARRNDPATTPTRRTVPGPARTATAPMVVGRGVMPANLATSSRAATAAAVSVRGGTATGPATETVHAETAIALPTTTARGGRVTGLRTTTVRAGRVTGLRTTTVRAGRVTGLRTTTVRAGTVTGLRTTTVSAGKET